LEEVDGWLPQFSAKLMPGDLAILTADHGCDPTTPSTNHSREYVPLLVYGPRAKGGVNLGLRATLSDIGETVADNFQCHLVHGASFLPAIATK
ncbi:MAG: phosphopentomutase, partial [Pseudomonadota bacterium]